MPDQKKEKDKNQINESRNAKSWGGDIVVSIKFMCLIKPNSSC